MSFLNNLTSTNATGIGIGPNGNTNASFVVDCSTASAATGLKVKSAAAAAGLAVTTISSGANENLTLDAKGTGTVTINGTATGAVKLSSLTTITSANANALAVGANGTTNPVIQVDASTGSVATGLLAKGAAAAGGMALSVISSGANENLTLDAKGTGTVTFNGTATGQIVMGALFRDTAADSLTAHAGGGQGSALALTKQNNRITTVATAADSVALPASAAGMEVIVINSGANPMQVFGAGTDTINGVATATGVSQMANSLVLYTCVTAGAWFTEGLGTGFSASFPTQSAVNSLTAFATGGQASATALTATINRVTTVATIGDSVKLPTSAVGMVIAVSNAAAANAMDIFPASGDIIDALAANTAVRVNAGTTLTFWCSVAGTWHSSARVLPPSKYTKNTTAGVTTAAVGDLTGAAFVCAEYSAVGAANLTTRTATQMFNDMGNVQAGDSYMLQITNTSGGTTTLVAGTGVTLTGTMTMATNTTRMFNVKFTSATALVIQSVGVGTIS
jgi:hypothetical protein